MSELWVTALGFAAMGCALWWVVRLPAHRRRWHVAAKRPTHAGQGVPGREEKR